MAEKNRGRKGSRDPDWNLEKIQELIDLLAEREIGEFEMERNGFRVRIRRDTSKRPASPAGEPAQSGRPGESLGSVPLAAPAPLSAATPSPEATAAAEPAADSAEDVFIIKSPIVGTFYASPAPNALPFVKLHDAVQVGQVLCIVEAMKLMNEIESEVAGEIVRIYIESGQPVEYGQPLFAIMPSHKK
jgi:acetyl-CoA carboxylase biotin carboxyl carrier protein